MSIHTFIVDKKEQGLRLLRFLQNQVDTPRNDIRFAIEHQGCLVNNEVERFASRRVQTNDKITLRLKEKPKLSKQNIIFEDDDLLVFDKPSHIPSEEISRHLNLDLVHRLDQGTSGVLLFGKNEESMKYLKDAFLQKKVHKEYLAWVEGKFSYTNKVVDHPITLQKKGQGKISASIHPKGKSAKTIFSKVKTEQSRSLVRAIPITGRTHQIRCHLKHLGFPILGDIDYNCQLSNYSRLHLHAEKVELTHPTTGKKCVFFSFLPKDFYPKNLSHLKSRSSKKQSN